MFRYLFVFGFLSPLFCLAHPGIAIVKDSKGNIYYSDLQRVWKISGGEKTIAVPNVHTHELYIDKVDKLYGEDVTTVNDSTFRHTLWVLKPNGTLETVVPAQQAYVDFDYSLARDVAGNQYYVKDFIGRPDTAHVYKKTPDGRETVLARGNFKSVTWLHPQADGSLLLVLNNNVCRIAKDGALRVLARNIASEKPSFAFSGDSKTVWGLWQDDSANVYAAVFSDQTVKKIDRAGLVTDYYVSKGQWAPNHGVFDGNGQLWLLESSDQNETRVVKAMPESKSFREPSAFSVLPAVLLLFAFVATTIGVLRITRNGRRQ